ncbi:MAG: hypothetical protein QM778_32810 [Myxococcales bacterium]
MRKSAIFSTLVLVLGAPSLGLGQVGEHGRISTRSDVKMSIEGAPGTSGPKLDAMAKHLGTPLGEVKRCYADVVKEHPDVVGTLHVTLELREGKGAPAVQVPDAVGKLKPMDKCIDKAFGKLDMSEVPRPAAAKVILELTNSAAHAVEDVRAKGDEASRVDVTTNPDGSFEAKGQSLEGEVSYRVRSKDKEGAKLVEAVSKKIRDSLPGLFDCRRRASKKDSPEGDLVFKAKLSPSAPATVDFVSTTVKNERAPFCSTNAIKPALAKVGRGTAEITIHFAP